MCADLLRLPLNFQLKGVCDTAHVYRAVFFLCGTYTLRRQIINVLSFLNGLHCILNLTIAFFSSVNFSQFEICSIERDFL